MPYLCLKIRRPILRMRFNASCHKFWYLNLSNVKMKSIIIVAALVSLSYQMTTVHHTVHHTHGAHTNAPHTTHEPSVMQQYIFHYDYTTHKMIVHKDKNCYIFTLTDQERMDVHTESGLTALEVQFLTRISTGTTTEVSRSSVGHIITTACGFNIQHFYTVA